MYPPLAREPPEQVSAPAQRRPQRPVGGGAREHAALHVLEVARQQAAAAPARVHRAETQRLVLQSTYTLTNRQDDRVNYRMDHER